MKPVTQNIHFHNAQNVQLGDYNTQNVVNIFQVLVDQIEKSDAAPAEKEEAKSRLRAFLDHPTVASVLGGLTSGIIGLA